MFRYDRLLNDARAMRVRRALREQGAVEPVPFDFFQEMLAAQAILAGFGRGDGAAPRPVAGELAARGYSPTAPVHFSDPALIAEFVAKAVPALQAAAAEVNFVERSAAALESSLRATPAYGRHIDASATRRAALADVAVLAMENALLEVVRAFVAAGDRARPTRLSALTGRYEVVDGMFVKRRRTRRTGASARSAAGAPATGAEAAE